MKIVIILLLKLLAFFAVETAGAEVDVDELWKRLNDVNR